MNTPGTPLSGLSEQQLRAYLEPFGQEEDQLKHQMQVAEALRNYQPPQSYGLGAGIGNGVATAINGLNGAIRDNRAQSGMADMLKREQSSAMPLAQQLIQALRNQGQQQTQQPQYAPLLADLSHPGSYGT